MQSLCSRQQDGGQPFQSGHARAASKACYSPLHIMCVGLLPFVGLGFVLRLIDAEGVRMFAGLDSDRRQDTAGRVCDGLACGTVPAGGHRGLPLHPQQHPGCHHHLWAIRALRWPACLLPLEGLHRTLATCLVPPACTARVRRRSRKG